MKAFQESYADDLAHCYGCGRLNSHGHQLKSYWDGERTLARFVPKPYHTAILGFVNGGLLASLVDCHATGTAAAVAARARGGGDGSAPFPRFVTASLKVDYVRPTPLGPELLIHGQATSVSGRKIVVAVSVSADGVETVRGEVVCVELPDSMRPSGTAST